MKFGNRLAIIALVLAGTSTVLLAEGDDVYYRRPRLRSESKSSYGVAHFVLRQNIGFLNLKPNWNGLGLVNSGLTQGGNWLGNGEGGQHFEAVKEPVEASESFLGGEGWLFTLGSRTSYRHTEYQIDAVGSVNFFGRPFTAVRGKDDADSDTIIQTFSFTMTKDAFSMSIIVPLEIEKFRTGYYDINDNTRIGIILAPSYKFLNAEQHGLDLSAGIHTGWHHICYSHDMPPVRFLPPGTTGVTNEDSDLYVLGMSVDGEVPLPLGSIDFSFLQTWAWDLSTKKMLAGNDFMDFQNFRTRYKFPFLTDFYGAVGLNWSYSEDLPSDMDNCTFRYFLEAGYQKDNWAAGLNFSQDLWDDNVNECTFGMQMSYSW